MRDNDIQSNLLNLPIKYENGKLTFQTEGLKNTPPTKIGTPRLQERQDPGKEALVRWRVAPETEAQADQESNLVQTDTGGWRAPRKKQNELLCA